MPLTPFFCEDNGAAVATAPALGGGNRGTTRTTGVNNVNWKNIDDATTFYGSVPISAGSNSYEKFQFVFFSGAYNQVGSCLFQHVTGDYNAVAGLTIKLFISGSGAYTTPSTAANSLLSNNANWTGLITTGYNVKVGFGGPEASGKATTTSNLSGYSEYLITQLQTTSSASAGDTPLTSWQFRYSEN
jgi:hypothetical protein